MSALNHRSPGPRSPMSYHWESLSDTGGDSLRWDCFTVARECSALIILHLVCLSIPGTEARPLPGSHYLAASIRLTTGSKQRA